MPGGDRTGPIGAGPMTGRGAGYCAGYPVPGFADGVWGRGFRNGGAWSRGGGFGHRNRFWATGLTGWQRAASGWPADPSTFRVPAYSAMTKEQEVETLERQAAFFERSLEEIKKRIQEIGTPSDEHGR